MMKFPVQRPPGESPRETPRTRQLKDLRHKRLAYFDNKLRESSDALVQGNDDVQAVMTRASQPVLKGVAISSSPNPPRKATTIDVRNNLFVLPEKLFPNGPRKRTFFRNSGVGDGPKSPDGLKGVSTSNRKSTNVKSKAMPSPSDIGNQTPSSTRSSSRKSKSQLTSQSSSKKEVTETKMSPTHKSYRDNGEDHVPPLAINLLQDDMSDATSLTTTPRDSDRVGILDGDIRLDVKSSPRTVSRFLEPQFEEDFTGLSLSSNHMEFSGPVNGASDAEDRRNISTNFENSQTISNRVSEVLSNVRSSIADDLETSKLEAILGKDRFKRLLKNFEESDWALTSDESNVVTPRSAKSGQGHRYGDMDLESVRTEEVESVTQNKTEFSQISERLDRDKDANSEFGSDIKPLNAICKTSSETDPANFFENAQDYIRHIKENAKFAFSSDEIYSQVEEERNVGKNTKGSETIKSLNALEQPNMSYKQWMMTELSKSADAAALQGGPSTVVTDGQPYFQRQSTFDESESELTQEEDVINKNNTIPSMPQVKVDLQPPSEEPALEGQIPSDVRHVLGIMQHMQRRELRKHELPEPLPPGQYSSPSLERYFSSLENISNGNVSSQDFDPIADVEIEETPRDDLAVKGQPKLAVSRPKTASKSPRHFSSSETKTKKKTLTPEEKPQPSTSTENPSKPVFSDERQKNKTSRSIKGQKPSEVRVSMDTVVTMATEETETSIWDENSSGHQNIFLTKKGVEGVGDIASDFFTKGKKSNWSLTPKESASNTRFNDDKSRINEGGDESSLLSSSVPSKVLEEDTSKVQLISSNISKFDMPENVNSTSMRNSVSMYASVENTSTLVTEKGVIPCPDCETLNKDYLKWCLECGAQLQGEDVVMEFSPRKKKSQSSENIAKRDTAIHSSKVESLESIPVDEAIIPEDAELQQRVEKASSSLQAAAMNPKDSFRSRLEHHMASSSNQDVGSDKDNFNLKLSDLKLNNEELGESHYFQYSEEDQPSSRLSVSLQRELSIDLSLSRSIGRLKHQASPAEEKFVAMSENFDFEYENAVSPSKSLPPDLAEELSLNLEGCLEKSMPASRFKQEQQNEDLESVSQDIENQEADANIVLENDDERGQQVPELRIDLEPDEAEGHVDLEEDQCHQGGHSPENREENQEDLRYEDIPIDNDDDDEEFDEETDDGYKIFLDKLRNDPRFRPKSSQSPVMSSQGPSASKGRPLSASNSKYRSSAQSKVRASWDTEPRARRWEKSGSAWGTYSSGERPRSSIYSVPLKSRSSNSPINSLGRPSSAKSMRPNSASRPNRASQLRASSAGRVRSNVTHSMPVGMDTQYSGNLVSDHSPRSARDLLKVRSAPIAKELSGLRKQALGTYDRLLEMSPRVFGGEISYWLCLPDEIWLHILSFLTRQELARIARTCKQLHRVAIDDSLWRSICLKKRQRVSDDWLTEIGRRRPMCLALIKCQGERVTDNGLRELFRMVADSLQELNFSGCNRGMLTGDHILLHAASRCRFVTHLDASWCNVSDNGLVAISEASNRLEVLCVNGCQALTDDAINSVLVKHGLYLRELELFGCFNLTARSVTSVINNCKGLVSLNLGQCWALSDVSLLQLATSGSVSQLDSLDLQGCKQLKDNAVHMLVRNCAQLRTLSIACCPLVTDASLSDIASQGRSLRSLDLHDCTKLTVNGIRAIALGCTQLRFLDISNTKANHKSISQLASYCHRELEVLKVNFCKDLTIPSLSRLVKNCAKMKKLYLYGVKGIRNIEEVRRANPSVWIEM